MSHLLLVQSVILNRPCGERSSNSIKTEARRAAVTTLGGPHRDNAAAAEAMSPLAAADGRWRPNNVFSSLGWHLYQRLLSTGGKTQRDHLPVSGEKKKEKSVSMTTLVFKLPCRFRHGSWHKVSYHYFFSAHLHFAPAHFRSTFLPPAELSRTITSPIILLRLCRLLPLIFLFLSPRLWWSYLFPKARPLGLRWEN